MTSANTRHKSSVALILIDVISDFDFPDGPGLLRHALPIAPRVARLKERATHAGIPAIYLNDNFGQWRSETSRLVEYCLRPNAAGRRFVETIRPDKEDHFVLKPTHSAFFQTPLECCYGAWARREPIASTFRRSNISNRWRIQRFCRPGHFASTS